LRMAISPSSFRAVYFFRRKTARDFAWNRGIGLGRRYGALLACTLLSVARSTPWAEFVHRGALSRCPRGRRGCDK
jgi:hypothetical protein